MTARLELRNVTRVHGSGRTKVTALINATLRVMPGELVAVMGPSGSGKTTLLSLAGGLDRPTSGQVFVDGVSLGGMSTGELATLRRRKVGYVFQQFNLIEGLTALENVSVPLELDGKHRRAATRAAMRALTDLGLKELADRFPDELSGGEQQRVAIARAVVGDRQLLLADEPTGALDSKTGEEIMQIFTRLNAEQGITIILVTHESDVAAYARRIIHTRDGLIGDEEYKPQRTIPAIAAML